MFRIRSLRQTMPAYPATKRMSFYAILSLSLIGVAVYLNSFGVEFQFDDVPVITKNYLIRHLTDAGRLFFYDPTRFLTHLSFALNYHFHGPNPFYFHLVNLVLHIICAVLVFCIVRSTLLIRSHHTTKDSSAVFPAAFFCSLIFLVHPIQTEAVTYIAQRSTLLAALFVF